MNIQRRRIRQSALALARIAKDLADRFERLCLDEEGNMDLSDRKLLSKVREQTEKVLFGR